MSGFAGPERGEAFDEGEGSRRRALEQTSQIGAIDVGDNALC
jgi:hypothetical protein